MQLRSSDKDLNAFDKLLQLRADASVVTSGTGPGLISFSARMNDGLLPILRAHPMEMQRVLDYLRSSRDGDKSILA